MTSLKILGILALLLVLATEVTSAGTGGSEQGKKPFFATFLISLFFGHMEFGFNSQQYLFPSNKEPVIAPKYVQRILYQFLLIMYLEQYQF